MTDAHRVAGWRCTLCGHEGEAAGLRPSLEVDARGTPRLRLEGDGQAAVLVPLEWPALGALLGQAMRLIAGPEPAPTPAGTVPVARLDLERVTTAATSYVALMQLAPQVGAPALRRAIGGELDAGPAAGLGPELAALGESVARLRRLLGWRA